jgi:hypothetical protein
MTPHTHPGAIRPPWSELPIRPTPTPNQCPVSAQPCPYYPNAPLVCEPCASQPIPSTLRAAS